MGAGWGICIKKLSKVHEFFIYLKIDSHLGLKSNALSVQQGRSQKGTKSQSFV